MFPMISIVAYFIDPEIFFCNSCCITCFEQLLKNLLGKFSDVSGVMDDTPVNHHTKTM